MKRRHINWKRIVLISLDIVLGAYIVVAFTAFGKPRQAAVCTQVNISIQDEATNGFITAPQVKQRLKDSKLYPLSKPMDEVNTRAIEDALKQSPFVKTTECYKTQDCHVCIALTQRMPIVRIKAANGDDYYIDDDDRIMPNTHYTSNLIIATGSISRWFAKNYISHLATTIMGSPLWSHQIVQINVLPDRGIELVPRVGDHIVYVGQLPETKYPAERKKLVGDFMEAKLDRLEKFYRYGLSQAGWNKYAYIDIEFDNQIICKRRTEN